MYAPAIGLFGVAHKEIRENRSFCLEKSGKMNPAK